jgi:hypothetical protein
LTRSDNILDELLNCLAGVISRSDDDTINVLTKGEVSQVLCCAVLLAAGLLAVTISHCLFVIFCCLSNMRYGLASLLGIRNELHKTDSGFMFYFIKYIRFQVYFIEYNRIHKLVHEN